MKNDRLKKYGLNDKELISLSEIKYIKLKNNRMIFPNKDHVRFKTDGKYLYIYYGELTPCGDDIPKIYSLSGQYDKLYLPLDHKSYYPIRPPKEGDILVQHRNNKILTRTIISNITSYVNTVTVSLGDRLIYDGNGFELTFYDPLEYKATSEHNKFGVGHYYNFSQFDKSYNEKIKIKEIIEIKE